MKSKIPLIVDAHEDLAYNKLTLGRDYSQSAEAIRRSEVESPLRTINDDTVLGWSEYQRGRVAVVFGTLFAAPAHASMGAWDQVYSSVDQAYRLYQKQIDIYEELVDRHPDKFRLIYKKNDLEGVLADWKEAPLDDWAKDQPNHLSEEQPEEEADEQASKRPPVGLVILMEGAEGVRQVGELEEWWKRGVRLIGPAWTGTRFCGGSHQPGPMTAEGFALLEGMAEVGFILDLTHMDEKAVLQALDAYPGQIVASHSNALALLKGYSGNRHLSDQVIQGILERDGVIGVVPFNAFLQAGWRRGDRRETVGLEHVVAQIDYICQMAGDARHVGLGTDFDGGFGLQCVPPEIDTIADLQKLAPLLQEKGYSEQDVQAILGENWLERLRRVLP